MSGRDKKSSIPEVVRPIYLIELLNWSWPDYDSHECVSWDSGCPLNALGDSASPERLTLMSKNCWSRSGSAALLLFFAFVIASAQEFRGSITGQVTDPNGAVVAGATVTLKNVATNTQTTTTTNGDGSYDFLFLQPGKYTLTVNAQGFSAATREGIEIRVADKLTLD